MMEFNVGIATRYQLFSVNPTTGRETALTGQFGNTILRSGRNEMPNRDWFSHCQVGTSNALPDALQTSMQGYKAGTNTIMETVSGAQASAPFYGWRRRRFRFTVGSTAAILNEIGIGWGLSGDTLATRALIVDVDGIPTSVVPLPDEYLDAVVEIRYYPPLGDSTGVLLMDGINYNYTIRAAQVTSSSAWGFHNGNQIKSYGLFISDWSSYNDNIGAITDSPSGLVVPADTVDDYTLGYAVNSFQIKFGQYIGPNGWNQTTGKLLRSIRLCTTAGYYQAQFDSQANPGFGLPKNNGRILHIQANLGFQEQIIP